MSEENKIISRLDALILLVLYSLKESDNLPKSSELIYKLKQIGMSNENLANILGKSQEQIAKLAYEFKRPSKSKSKNG